MFDDPRWDDSRDRDDGRERESRDRDMEGLDLSRGLERELVHERDREYTLRGSESRTLSVVGAFRVVSSRDLLDHHDRPADPRTGDLRYLREQGLIRTVPLHGHRLHRRWLTDGEAALDVVSSQATADAIERGAGRVECHVLPFSYRYLSPLVDVPRPRSRGPRRVKIPPPRESQADSTPIPQRIQPWNPCGNEEK